MALEKVLLNLSNVAKQLSLSLRKTDLAQQFSSAILKTDAIELISSTLQKTQGIEQTAKKIGYNDPLISSLEKTQGAASAAGASYDNLLSGSMEYLANNGRAQVQHSAIKTINTLNYHQG